MIKFHGTHLVARVRILLGIGLIVAVCMSGCLPGGEDDCPTISPRELPSGAAPGTAQEGVAGGAKQVAWGIGEDRVDLRIGISYMASDDLRLHRVTVRGNDAVVFQIIPTDQVGLGLTWKEAGCSYTVFLDDAVDAPSLVEYAARY